jgi:hypothetical protein
MRGEMQDELALDAVSGLRAAKASIIPMSYRLKNITIKHAAFMHRNRLKIIRLDDDESSHA